jgi:hypothetical protein
MRAIGAVFQPELIELMKSVLDDATAMLPEAKRTSSMKAEIASYILECAAKGERNPIALKTAALSAVVECSREALTRQLSYHAIPLPKLDVVSVNKLLCRFDCCAVVTTIKNYRFHEMTVAANYVCSVVGHMAHDQAGALPNSLSPNSAEGRGDDVKPIAQSQTPSVR